MAITIEIISDLEQGGFTARLPDISAYGEGDTEEDEAIDDMKEAVRVPPQFDDALSRVSELSLRVRA